MLITPDLQLERILRDAAESGTFIPYTNTEQDVLESVFAAHPSWPPPTEHTHSRELACRVPPAAADADTASGARAPPRDNTAALLLCDRRGVSRTLLTLPASRLACCPHVFRQPFTLRRAMCNVSTAAASGRARASISVAR